MDRDEIKLIDAAKPVVAAPALPPSASNPASQRAGRAHTSGDFESPHELHRAVGAGEAIPEAPPETPRDARIVGGVAREVMIPRPLLRSRGDEPAPATGIWLAMSHPDHRHATLFNDWARQCYVEKGATFPDPRETESLAVDPADITWFWCGQANTGPVEGYLQIDVAPAPASRG